jgi:hypothetical protein
VYATDEILGIDTIWVETPVHARLLRHRSITSTLKLCTGLYVAMYVARQTGAAGRPLALKATPARSTVGTPGCR